MAYRLSEEKENTIYTWIDTVFNSNEIQKVRFDAAPDSGAFTLSYGVETSGLIDFDATAAEIKAVLELMPNIDEVAIYNDMPKNILYIEFKGSESQTDVEMLNCDIDLLGNVSSVVVSEYKKGSANAEIEWSYSDEERSEGRPLIILNMLPILKEGSPATSYKDTDTYTKHYKYTFSLTVEIISETNFWEYIEILERAPEDDQQRALLETAGLYLRRVENPLDLTATLTEHEHRVSLEFFFAYADDVDIYTAEINKITADGEFESTQGTTTENIDVDIN